MHTASFASHIRVTRQLPETTGRVDARIMGSQNVPGCNALVTGGVWSAVDGCRLALWQFSTGAACCALTRFSAVDALISIPQFAARNLGRQQAGATQHPPKKRQPAEPAAALLCECQGLFLNLKRASVLAFASLDIWNQQQRLWELWETRSVFGGEFSKPCGNRWENRRLILPPISTGRQFPQPGFPLALWR